MTEQGLTEQGERDERAGPPRLVGALPWALYLVLSAIAALFGAMYSRLVIPVVGVPVPVGLVLGVGVPMAVVLCARLLVTPRAGMVCAVVWAVVVAALLLYQTGGDVLIADDWLGYGYLLLSLAGFGWSVLRSASAARRLVSPSPPA